MASRNDKQGQGSELDPDELARRRSKARRTAGFLGAVVLLIFLAFLVTGITGRG